MNDTPALMMPPAALILALRSTDPYIEEIFLHGGCYRFYLFLKICYPEAVAFIHKNEAHVVSEINGRLYDIRGPLAPSLWEMYRKMKPKDHKHANQWSFSRNNLIKLTECPYCEEPFIYTPKQYNQ